jgi:HSP20 family protein
MNTLMKSTRVPLFRSMMEDFWNTENLFGRNVFDGDRGDLPAVNIKETDKTFDIEVAAPGFQKQDFKVDIEKGLLTISAENKSETEESQESYTRREFSYSSFSRSFTLPESVKQEDIKAKYDNGLLRLTLQKSEQAQVQKKMISIE